MPVEAVTSALFVSTTGGLVGSGSSFLEAEAILGLTNEAWCATEGGLSDTTGRLWLSEAGGARPAENDLNGAGETGLPLRTEQSGARRGDRGR